MWHFQFFLFLFYCTHCLANNDKNPPSISESEKKINGNLKIVCYFTNWSFYRRHSAKYTQENIDEKLCTHIVYAFAVLDPSTLTIQINDPFTDIRNKLYEKVTGLKRKGVKVLIAFGGGRDSKDVNKYQRLLSDRSARQNFIISVKEFIERHNFDGLDLDLEVSAIEASNDLRIHFICDS